MPKDRDHPRPARQIVKSLAYSADKKLKIKVSTRDLPFYPDPAVIPIDQLKEVYIDGELEPVRRSASTSMEGLAEPGG